MLNLINGIKKYHERYKYTIFYYNVQTHNYVHWKLFKSASLRQGFYSLLLSIVNKTCIKFYDLDTKSNKSLRLRVKHLIHASYKSYNRKQVHKFTTIQANFWTEIPKSQTTAKTKLPCRCSNSPILKRTLFQFYISHLNKKKLLIKRVFKVFHFICRKATLHLGGPYFLLTSLYACFPFWMLSRNHLVKQLYFDEFRKYSIVQTDR